MFIESNGLKELQRNLRDLERRVRRLNGEQGVPIDELLTAEFMSLNTRFPTFDSMLNASVWDVSSEADFEAIPDDVWDEYVAVTTDFDDWGNMLAAATQEWTVRQLEF